MLRYTLLREHVAMSHDLFQLNRRRFLAVSAVMLGSLSVRGKPLLAAAPAHFTHGVASGDPLQDRVILWTRVLPGSGQPESIQLEWQVASDQRFSNVVASGMSSTGPERDFTPQNRCHGT